MYCKAYDDRPLNLSPMFSKQRLVKAEEKLLAPRLLFIYEYWKTLND